LRHSRRRRRHCKRSFMGIFTQRCSTTFTCFTRVLQKNLWAGVCIIIQTEGGTCFSSEKWRNKIQNILPPKNKKKLIVAKKDPSIEKEIAVQHFVFFMFIIRRRFSQHPLLICKQFSDMLFRPSPFSASYVHERRNLRPVLLLSYSYLFWGCCCCRYLCCCLRPQNFNLFK
jgi:hypothetical protein